MRDILTITLNPAIDMSTKVDHVVPGPKLRCEIPRFDPGGGGVNVARAIRKLGGEATALVTAGGPTGAQLLALLAAESVPTLAVQIAGDTRQSFAVIDEKTQEQYRFGVPGPSLTAPEAERLLADIARAAPKEGCVVLSGSMPLGLPDDFPAQVQAAIAPKTDRLIVDIADAPLVQLITNPTHPIHVLRVNRREAAEVSQRDMATVSDNVIFARSLVERGVAHAVVFGREAEGSLLITRDQQFFCHAPRVPIKSKVGAGDSFVGALTYALARGLPFSEALQWGVATASSTVMTEGTELCEAHAAQALLARCKLEAL